MYLIYTSLALAEVFVLLASAAAVLFLVARGIVRVIFFKPKDETKRVRPEDLLHLKRAGV